MIASLDQRIMPNVASNEQNQCFTVAVGAQLTISNCLTRHKVYEMQSVDEMDPTGQAVFGNAASSMPFQHFGPSQRHGASQNWVSRQISRNFSKMADFPLEDEAIRNHLAFSDVKSTDEKLGNIHCKSKCCAILRNIPHFYRKILVKLRKFS